MCVRDSVIRCWGKKVAQIFYKLPKKYPQQFFTLIDLFQNSPKVKNLFGLLLKINLKPRTFKNRPIWSRCLQRFYIIGPWSQRLGQRYRSTFTFFIFYLFSAFSVKCGCHNFDGACLQILAQTFLHKKYLTILNFWVTIIFT